MIIVIRNGRKDFLFLMTMLWSIYLAVSITSNIRKFSIYIKYNN